MIVKEGDEGAAVGHVHQKLVENGFPVPQEELATVVCGEGTVEAIKSFQEAQGLTADGVVGPITWNALERPAKGEWKDAGWKSEGASGTAENLVGVAVSDIGTCEEPWGSNSGPGLVKYGGQPGNPWCAMAVCYWLGMVGVRIKKASAYKIRTWAEEQGFIRATPIPGDIAIVVRGDFSGHVGLVCAVDGDEIHTVEGNAGNAVRGKVRNLSAWQVFARAVPEEIKAIEPIASILEPVPSPVETKEETSPAAIEAPEKTYQATLTRHASTLFKNDFSDEDEKKDYDKD